MRDALLAGDPNEDDPMRRRPLVPRERQTLTDAEYAKFRAWLDTTPDLLAIEEEPPETPPAAVEWDDNR